MASNRDLEQHIAVFGESGSGKTVLLSSFFGPTQEPGFIASHSYNVTPDDAGQGTTLHRNYLGMRNSAALPAVTRFKADSYAFTVRLKDDVKRLGKQAFDAVHLVWHDYPGEWFEQDVEPEEATRRVDAFKKLLESDVAILLVDGQRLLDNDGEEERYLKSLFSNFRNGMLRLKEDLLEDGKPLLRFPRIWILALSKADLHPDMDVYAFRDLIVEKAGEDVNVLRSAIAEFIDSPQALSIGEDFLLLSSAKFEPDRIDVDEQVGVDLILPLASTLPFQRHVKWAKRKQFGATLAKQVLGRANLIATIIMTRTGTGSLTKRLASTFRKGQISAAIVAGAELLNERADELEKRAIAERDFMTAMLAGFERTLLEAERDSRRPTFLRSRK